MSASDKKRTIKRSVFPFYLKPLPQNQELLNWIGKHLKNLRGKKTIATVAKDSGIVEKELSLFEKSIAEMEAGTFDLCLGKMRQVLVRGYGRSLEDVLAACFKEHEKFLNPPDSEDDRVFERDWHYRICYSSENDDEPTPFLMGGRSKSFMWAVPFRRLTNQNLTTELLELAPVRKHSGETIRNSHAGAEVVHVIHGAINFFIKPSARQDAYIKELTRDK